MKAGVAWVYFIFLTMCGTYASEVIIQTEEGNVVVELDEEKAPQTCAQFKSFIDAKVYQNSYFQRNNSGTLMGGKPGPKAVGFAGPNFSWEKAAPGEFQLKHVRGAVLMSRTIGACNPEKRSNSTMFCIHGGTFPQDDGEFTVFGRVVSGMEVVDRLIAELQDGKNEKKRINFDIRHKKIGAGGVALGPPA